LNSPGNVKLEPKILTRAQAYISEKLGDKAPADKKPVKFVFHGGSGSDVNDIQEAIGYGVIKMNVDTDTQWSYWEGIKNFEEKYHDYLQGQIGNPEGPDKPNKKYYDVSDSRRGWFVNW
jgi:fructose-bisphosphate aldolase class II